MTREAAIRALHHRYVPKDFDGEYLNTIQARAVATQGRASIVDIEVPNLLANPSYVQQARWYAEQAGYRWISWYEPPIRDHHEEPPSRPHFVIARLDE